MDGVKTAIIGFIFVCIIFPVIVKNKSQFYMGLVAILLSMLFKMVAYLFTARQSVLLTAHAVEILLEVVAIVILVMAAGGLSARQLASEMGQAIEVMRRGEETSEVIIPVPEHLRHARREREEQPQRYVVNDEDDDPLYDPKRFNPTAGGSPPPADAGSPGPIPVEEPKPKE